MAQACLQKVTFPTTSSPHQAQCPVALGANRQQALALIVSLCRLLQCTHRLVAVVRIGQCTPFRGARFFWVFFAFAFALSV
jgi:D-ribose pyranose/furanose isomerase RbsD